MNNSIENKRIIANASLMYLRMGIMMVISFFTARITLEALGFVDYGINNVVGSLVSTFSLISGALSSSVSRFITFELGRGDNNKLNKVFSTSVNIHVIIAIIVVIAIETIGLWFLNNRMVIPADRLSAAHWVLQCSTLMFAINIFSVPYNAAIIAHERMDIYAYFTLFDAFSRLAIIFAIRYYGGDKLILFAIISLIPTLIKQLYYWLFCKRNFEECTYYAVWDKKIFKELFGFAGWSFIGTSAGVAKDQGVNITINLFCGPSVNAARGIATQINGILSQFVINIIVPINPQITKSYASKNYERLNNLIFKGTKFLYYLLMTLSIPVLIELKSILCLWLGKIPPHTVTFTRLIIIQYLIELAYNLLVVAQISSGAIKKYQIISGCTLLLNLPISYLLLRDGWPPESTIIASIIISIIVFAEILLFTRKSINLNIKGFLIDVISNLVIVTLVSFTIPYICHSILEESFFRIIITCIVSVVTSFLSIYFIGCNEQEKKFIQEFTKKQTRRFYKNKASERF